MTRPLQGLAHWIDGILDVTWEMSLLEVLRPVNDGAILNLTYEDQMRNLARHCLIRVDHDFPRKVGSGDFFVGSQGVSWGHCHDHAALACKGLDLTAVLCETSTVNFRRNCINRGFP